MPTTDAQPQTSCMLQLPHAKTLNFDKCTLCNQDHIVRRLSHKKKDQFICAACMHCNEGGYWPAGQCSGACCARLRALGTTWTVSDILNHNVSFKNNIEDNAALERCYDFAATNRILEDTTEDTSSHRMPTCFVESDFAAAATQGTPAKSGRPRLPNFPNVVRA
eukprot:700656-Heterocapsa_arctica.AAC.1